MKFEWDKIAGRSYFFLGVAGLILIPAVLAYMGLGVIGILFALPVLAWIAARLLVHGGAEALGWFSRSAVEEWEGSYYAFNDVQVRIYEDEGELWFVAADVLKAIGLPELPAAFRAAHPNEMRTVPGTRLSALNPAGIENMLAKRSEHEAGRFLHWMRRDVIGPWEKKKRF